MPVRYVFAILFTIAAFVSALAALSLWNDLIDQVNRIALPQDRIPEWASHRHYCRVIQLHKQFYPDSRSRRSFHKLRWFALLTVLMALACAVTFK